MLARYRCSAFACEPFCFVFCVACGDVFICGVLRPRALGDFPFGESHQSHLAPEGSPANNAGSSHLGWPQEVRIRRIPAPDAHVCDPSHTLSGSTSACPRHSLAYGAEEQRCQGFCAVGPRMARPSTAGLWPSVRRTVRGIAPVARRCRDAPSGDYRAKTEDARGLSRHPGSPFFW